MRHPQNPCRRGRRIALVAALFQVLATRARARTGVEVRPASPRTPEALAPR
ncbi:hypothetical protein [Novosphingobium soli]|uniref:Uncharacterized protein n=1 Tax=Novosphingobium soli TaxID=574956 RepID=A0ABV6CVT7_9SPHN